MVSYPVENGKTFSPVLGRKVTISSPMQRLLNALTVHGYVDPIRDGGKSGTFVALIQRGILRETKGRYSRHYPATTPAQVEADAYAEDERRTAELEAHADCPEQWVQADEGGDVRHVRRSRQGYPIEIEESNHGTNFWYVRINGRTPMTAGGTFEEARRAADRFERDQVHAEAYDANEALDRQHAAVEVATRELGPIDKAAITSRRVDSLMNSGVTEPQQPAPSLADDACCKWVESGGITTHEDECPRFWCLTDEEAAYRRSMAQVEHPTVAPSFSDDVAALRRVLKYHPPYLKEALDRIAAQRVDPTHVADIARHQFRQVLAVEGVRTLSGAASRRFEGAIERIEAAAAGR